MTPEDRDALERLTRFSDWNGGLMNPYVDHAGFALLSKLKADLRALISLASPSPAQTGTGPRGLRWCQPPDDTHDRIWIVRFADQDRGEAVFKGPDAEAEARAYFERAWPAWTCWLFATAPWSSPSPAQTETPQPTGALAADLTKAASGLLHEQFYEVVPPSPSPAQWPEDVVERAQCSDAPPDIERATQAFWCALNGDTTEWSDVSEETRAELRFAVRAALATLPPPEDAARDQIVEAWIDGATAVHNAWIEGNGGREADFTEAAHDYADSLPTPPEDERVKGLVRALEYIADQGSEMWAGYRAASALASYRGGA